MAIVLRFKKISDKGAIGTSFRKHPRKSKHPVRSFIHAFQNDFPQSSCAKIKKVNINTNVAGRKKNAYELTVVKKVTPPPPPITTSNNVVSDQLTSSRTPGCYEVKKTGATKFKIIFKKKADVAVDGS